MQDYPMDRQQTITNGPKLMLQMLDLTDIIFEYCDSQSLFKLSMTCSRVNHQLTSENLQDRALKKGYLLRILKFKYSEASSRLNEM